MCGAGSCSALVTVVMSSSSSPQEVKQSLLGVSLSIIQAKVIFYSKKHECEMNKLEDIDDSREELYASTPLV